MTYRECRNFVEMLRALNYPRLVSLENFRKPNFELVADILYWLAQRYDPNTDISDNINEEHNRVEFIKSITTLFTIKARLKINPKKLYQADAAAVQEMLKITTVLYKVSITPRRPTTRPAPRRSSRPPSRCPPRSPTSRRTRSWPARSRSWGPSCTTR